MGVLNLRFTSEGVRKFVLAPRLARIACELTGATGVRIFHEQALFKEPGGGITHWHQDGYYWPTSGPMWDPVQVVMIPKQRSSEAESTCCILAGLVTVSSVAFFVVRLYSRMTLSYHLLFR